MKGLMGLSRVLVFISIISFIIRLYLILLIDTQKFDGTKLVKKKQTSPEIGRAETKQKIERAKTCRMGHHDYLVQSTL
jgi:hypothetical protein